MKKSLFIAGVCLLLGFAAKAQPPMSIDVYNDLPVDVDLNVVALGPWNGMPCQDLAALAGSPGYPLTNIPPNSSVVGVYNDPAPTYDYEMYLRVEPNGANAMISTIGAWISTAGASTTQCGYLTSFDVPVTGVSLVHVRVIENPAGNPQFTMYIYL